MASPRARSARLRFLLPLSSAVSLLAMVAGACGGDDEAADMPARSGTLAMPSVVADAGELTICADITYPPLTFVEGNEPVGVDVDFADRLAGFMGTEARFVQTGFAGIIAALEAGKCDAIMNGMNVSAEREEQLDFVTYAQASQAFMVQAGDAGEYGELEDFAGKSVGVAVGSTNLEFLHRTNARFQRDGLQQMKIVAFPRDPDAVNSLRTGRLDAYFADIAVVAFYSEEAPGEFAATDVVVNPIPYGIGIREEDDDLERALREGVDRLYESGEAQRILDKWGMGEAAYRREG